MNGYANAETYHVSLVFDSDEQIMNSVWNIVRDSHGNTRAVAENLRQMAYDLSGLGYLNLLADELLQLAFKEVDWDELATGYIEQYGEDD